MAAPVFPRDAASNVRVPKTTRVYIAINWLIRIATKSSGD